MVRTTVGDIKPFHISVRVHQGSTLTYIQDQLSWLMMYVDDIAPTDAGV